MVNSIRARAEATMAERSFRAVVHFVHLCSGNVFPIEAFTIFSLAKGGMHTKKWVALAIYVRVAQHSVELTTLPGNSAM